MNFDHPEHSLEGSRLNSYTCVVMLVVMVVSTHLSYLNFFNYFFSKEVRSSCFGLGCACLEEGSVCQDPPKGPQTPMMG